MIKVTRLGSGDEFVINADLILTVEAKPDTVITLTTGHKFIVQEGIDEVIRRVVAYRRSVMQPLQG
ncbi:MAG: flagellar FlbD family protein [Bacillota bacterium]|nr:MAG: flagellar protein FlbD [Bacillota bacterium]